MRYTQEKCRCMVWVDESLPRLHVCGRCFVCSLCVGCAYGELWHEYSTSTARAHELLLMDERTSKPLISHRHPQTFAGGDMHGGSCSYRYLKMGRYATTGIVELLMCNFTNLHCSSRALRACASSRPVSLRSPIRHG